MRVLASSGQSQLALTQLISLSVRVFWLAVFMSGAVAVSPPAEAMKFYNRSAESVFVWVTGPPPPGIHLNPTSKSKRVKSGKSWVFKPGNLRRKMDLEPSDEYTFYVWSSKAARGGGGPQMRGANSARAWIPNFMSPAIGCVPATPMMANSPGLTVC